VKCTKEHSAVGFRQDSLHCLAAGILLWALLFSLLFMLMLLDTMLGVHEKCKS